jgi:hypothetical protein
MPENSRYAEIKETIQKRGEGEDGAPRMDTMKYAESVVDKLLKGGNIKIWAGANVGLINFLANWLPDSWQVCNHKFSEVNYTQWLTDYRITCSSRERV